MSFGVYNLKNTIFYIKPYPYLAIVTWLSLALSEQLTMFSVIPRFQWYSAILNYSLSRNIIKKRRRGLTPRCSGYGHPWVHGPTSGSGRSPDKSSPAAGESLEAPRHAHLALLVLSHLSRPLLEAAYGAGWPSVRPLLYPPKWQGWKAATASEPAHRNAAQCLHAERNVTASTNP